MSWFRDAVQRVKNLCKINNVYDCARPLLVLIGLFGAGGTWICRRDDGVYSVRNTKFSLLIFTLISLVHSPRFLMNVLVALFTVRDPPTPLLLSIALLIHFLKKLLTNSTVGIGCIMTRVHCKRLNTMFRIIHNVDSQLERAAHIGVKHWLITLKVTALTLITSNYSDLLIFVDIATNLHYSVTRIFDTCAIIMIKFSIHLLYMWTILFLLIIHERFVCLGKLLRENVTATSIHIVGGRRPHDNCMLRRIALARDVHEQLTEIVQLFSDAWRYVMIGLTVTPIIDTMYLLLGILVEPALDFFIVHTLFIPMIRVAVVIIICQANKAERRGLTARLRYLVARETDRDIIHQLQQYIMYNSYSVPGLIDFQFTDIDNALLLTIVDIIVSNALVIYSYTRQGIDVSDY